MQSSVCAVNGRVMCLAFWQLVTLLTCEVSDEPDKDPENAECLISVSWVPIFSYKECTKIAPPTLSLFYFCTSLL